MGFFRSPYHSSEDESPSFLGKAAGLAKLGAVVGLGIVAARGSLRLAGTQLIKLGEQDFTMAGTGKLSQTINRIVRSVSNEVASHSPTKNLLSSELGFLSEGLEKVEQSITTADLSQRRIESFVNGLVGHGVITSKEAETHAVALKTTFERVGTIDRPSGALDTIFTDHGLKAINKGLSDLGIAHSFNSLGAQREVFMHLLTTSADQSTSQATIASVMGHQESRKAVTDFLITGVRKEQKKSNVIREIMGINKNDFEQIKIREINNVEGNTHFDKRKYDALNEHLRNHPAYSGRPDVQDPASVLIHSVQEKINKLYGAAGQAHGSHEERDIINKAFHMLDTGFVLTKQGKVTSLPRAMNVASKATDTIINHLQLPLIPYVRSIPLKNFTSFMRTSSAHVHNLGFLNSAPELRRIFKDMSVDSRIISSRTGILSINDAQEISFHKAKLDQFDLSDNNYYRKLNDVRTTKVNNDYIENLTNFKGIGSHSEAHDLIYANQHKMGRIVGYDKNQGFLLEGNNLATAAALKQIHPGLVQSDPSKLHPQQLADFLIKQGHAGTLGEMSPTDLESALRHLSREASRANMDLAPAIKDIHAKIGGGANSAAQEEIYRNIGSPQDLRHTISVGSLDPATGYHDSPIDASTIGESGRRMSEKMYRSLLYAKNNLDNIEQAGRVEGESLIDDFKQAAQGLSGPGRVHLRLQEGVLDDLLHLAGADRLASVQGRISVDHEVLAGELKTLAEKAADLNYSSPLLKAFEDKGYKRDEISSMIKETFKQSANEETAKSAHAKVGKIGTLLLDYSDVSVLTEDRNVQAKLINNLYDNFTSFSSLTSERRNELTFDLLSRGEIDKTLAKRFRTGRGFHPAAEKLNPLSSQRTYVTQSVAPSVAEFINDPIGSTKALMSSIFDTAAGLVDPDAPLNSVSAALQSMLQRPNNIGEKVGLGLNAQDRITAGRSMTAFYLKRVAPLAIGYEAYKNLNSNAHFMGLPGLDDLGANFLGNLRIGIASELDALGLTNPLKSFIHAIPGLDTYASVRSQKEEREYLYYGDEAVRSNRGSLYLSNSPLGGGRIEAYRPNFFRRWKSHWTEEMDLHSASHSYLPNLQNLAGPLNPFVYTNWFAGKHKDDRPYVGYSPGFVQRDSGQGGSNVGSAINSGATVNTGAGGGAGGNGQGTGEGGSYSINQFKYANSDAAPEINNLANFLSTNLHNIRSEMGLFGSVMSSIPGLNFKSDSARRQAPGDALGIGRSLYFNNYMGFLGGPGEYMRRFIHRSPGNKDDYSPLINNQPTWMPEKYHCITASTLVEIDGFKLTKAGDLKEGDLVRNRCGKLVPISVLKTRQMRNTEKLFEISIGGSLNFKHQLSEEHPLWTPNGWKQIQHINIGDWVGYPIPDITTLCTAPDIVDISKYLTNNYEVTDQWIYLNTLSKELITCIEHLDIFGKPIDTVHKILEDVGLEYVYEKHKNLWSKARRFLKGKLTNRIPRYLDTSSKEWGYFLGFYLAEGCSNGNGAGVKLCLHEDESHVVDRINNYFKSLISKQFKCYQYKASGKGMVAVLSCKPFSEFLLNYIGTDCTNKIVQFNINNYKETIAGLIDGDGFVTEYNRPKNPYRAGFKQPHNKQLCYQIWQILLASGIVASITDEGLDFKGINVLNYVKTFKGYKSLNIKTFNYSNKSSGHSFIENGFYYTKLRQKDIIPNETLFSITVDEESSFCVPALLTHNTGDPYLKIEYGELNLAGAGFQSTHPWDKPLRVRGSTVGLSVNEIIQKWLDPVGEKLDESGENITGFGSEVHEIIQKQLRDQGYLMGAEVSIFDAQHNISGTIDAILKGPNGPEIIDIKTQGGNHWGDTPEKYIDQINTYMAITGAKSGKLAFVNRDDMSQVRIESFAFDQERWQRTLDKIEYARGLVHQMEEKKMISPFETYDLLTRVEILAKTAPGSEAFRKHVQAATDAGGFGGFEKQRFDQALHQAHELEKQYKTTNYAYAKPMESHHLKVEQILSDGTILTKFGTLKLAGVKFDKQTFLQQDPEQVFARYGIAKGSYVRFQFSQGTFNPELSRGRTTEVIAQGANKALAHSMYAAPDYESDSPLARRALHGHNIVMAGLEKFLHSDNMVLNKIFRNRSALEQFERGEVYGSDKFDMHHPFKTGFIPLVTSLTNKHPVAAGIVTALATGMFFTEKAARSTAMKVAGVAGAGISALFQLYQHLRGRRNVSKRYKKATEFDSYWDAIKYLKAEAMANEAKRLSLEREGVDIDQNIADGRPIGTGTFAKLYQQANKKAQGTMVGFNMVSGTLAEALATLPSRHRQLAEEIALYGSSKEKQKFYDELSMSEKRVLGKFLGISKADLPKPVDFRELFKKHAMPANDWKGWDPLINEDDVETRSRSVEGIGVDIPNRNKVASARARTEGVQLPNYNYPTYHNIDRTIRELMKDYSGLSHAISVSPANKSSISIKYDLKYDATNELMHRLIK